MRKNTSIFLCCLLSIKYISYLDIIELPGGIPPDFPPGIFYFNAIIFQWVFDLINLPTL